MITNSTFPQERNYPNYLVYSIQALKDHKELGKFIYNLEEKEDVLHITIILNNEVKRKEAELWFSAKNDLPLRSQKWVYTPRDTLFLKSDYYDDHVEVYLYAGKKQKKAYLRFKKPVFDLEQLPFLIGKEPYSNFRSFSVFIPISGMIWKATLRKIQEDTDQKSFLLQVAGEKLYLSYQNDQLYPKEVKAPQRGYRMVLIRKLSD